MFQLIKLIASFCFLIPFSQFAFSQAVPSVDTAIEETEDGLYRVDPFVMGAAWVKPDLDLSKYLRLYLMPVKVQYRELPEMRNARSREGADFYVPTESLKAVFENSFSDYLYEEVSSVSSYQLSEEAGRDVLLVQAYLTDVVTGVPPDIPQAYTTTIRWLWEVGVVLELRDSMTGEILARTADRRRADGPIDANLAWTFTPRATSAWSSLLIRRLEELGDLSGRPDFWPLVGAPQD
ncbi:MAG: DUF3313 family protein [Gammaproteobacteria bacterium]|nr:DUF3313 family protein [Gammaproteobacteria bacterium]